MEGFRAELAEHGLLPAQEFVIDGLLNFANAWQQAGEIVGLRKRPFTALFCATEVLAMATLSRLQAAGIRVPRDLSVLGYDGAELGACTSPALSTVHGRRPWWRHMLAAISSTSVMAPGSICSATSKPRWYCGNRSRRGR